MYVSTYPSHREATEIYYLLSPVDWQAPVMTSFHDQKIISPPPRERSCGDPNIEGSVEGIDATALISRRRRNLFFRDCPFLHCAQTSSLLSKSCCW